MSYSIFYIAFTNLLSFYKSLRWKELMTIFILHIFISWNGIQFIINPRHIYIFIFSDSLNEGIKSVMDYQSAFIPSFFYIFCSLILCYALLKVFCGITFEQNVRGLKTHISERVNTVIDFCVPALFHNLGVLFILASVYLIFLVVYILLVIMNIEIILDVYNVIEYSMWYFAVGIVIFNIVLLDFILPQMSKGETFSDTLKRFFSFCYENKMNICFFYSLKLCMIGFSLMLYVLFLVYVVQQPLFSLDSTFSFAENMLNTSILALVMSVSIIIFSVFMQFFSLYCYQVKNILFSDFCEPIPATPEEVII